MCNYLPIQLGGAGHVTIASNEGIKMDTAKRLNCADAYIPLNRKDAKAQWEKIKADNPCESGREVAGGNVR